MTKTQLFLAAAALVGGYLLWQSRQDEAARKAAEEARRNSPQGKFAEILNSVGGIAGMAGAWLNDPATQGVVANLLAGAPAFATTTTNAGNPAVDNTSLKPSADLLAWMS